MTILIVEDEPEAREGLYQLLTEASPDWMILPGCSNGQAGLASAVRNQPDIIITDIRMPQQDGLAMIEQFRANNIPAAIIVLSGYPEFEYARRCLSLGVREYLLKPVTAEYLITVLKQVEAEIFSTSMLTSLIFPSNQVLSDQESLGSMTDQFLGEAAPVTILVPGVLVFCRYRFPLDSRQRQILKKEVRCLFGSMHRTLAAEGNSECWFYIEQASLDHIPPGAAGFVSHLSNRLGQPAVICGRKTAFGAIGETAMHLREDIQRFILFPNPDFLAVPLLQETVGHRREYAYLHEANFSQALREESPQAIGTATEAFFGDTFRIGFDPAIAIQQGQRFLFAVQNQIKDLDPSRFRKLLLWNPAGKLASAFRWEDVREIFYQLAAIFRRHETDDHDNTYNPKIQAALAIINDRLANPPSLGILADELHLNAEYLSRLFKQEVGEGYARFVMKQRIQLATRLLANRNLPINSIAEQVGFRNGKYFFEVFRKETGLTPSDYRSRFV